MSVSSGFKVDVERFRGSSNSKKADPMRNLRILQKSEKTPRNLFYLGRECYERGMYHDAIGWLLQYEGKWAPERAEAYLTLARCYWYTQQGDKAREACLRAIMVNPDFKEALLLMATMHYEPLKSRWAKLAEVATSEDVLFKRV
jgi:tetratricopeptide (TPR) repeat protein